MLQHNLTPKLQQQLEYSYDLTQTVQERARQHIFKEAGPDQLYDSVAGPPLASNPVNQRGTSQCVCTVPTNLFLTRQLLTPHNQRRVSDRACVFRLGTG